MSDEDVLFVSVSFENGGTFSAPYAKRSDEKDGRYLFPVGHWRELDDWSPGSSYVESMSQDDNFSGLFYGVFADSDITHVSAWWSPRPPK